MAATTSADLLTHAWALCALCAPTTNSYRRLVPGYEAPINLVYSQRNRSACCRIPMYSSNPRAKRVEFRSPDPSCNPYLAFAAMLMAGLDGINNRIDPGSPIDKNLYDLPPAEAKEVKSTPGSLDQALDALEGDHAFLLRGDVFTRDVIETWLDYKRKKEIDADPAAPPSPRVSFLLRHLTQSSIDPAAYNCLAADLVSARPLIDHALRFLQSLLGGRRFGRL